MAGQLQELPIGTQTFKILRRNGQIYVDKTEKLWTLTQRVRRCFLSRPRRFGKSMTISTLESMFSGSRELFEGLWFGEWLKNNSFEQSPVINLNMGAMSCDSPEGLNRSLIRRIRFIASRHGLTVSQENANDALMDLLEGLGRPVVLLIDEYDRPLLDYIAYPDMLESMQRFLRGFYSTVKNSDEYLRFLMLTGITKFSRVSIFSAMNNLVDISLDEQWGDLTGYTQAELECNFSDWIDYAALKQSLSRHDYLVQLKEYYDGFCFDGITKVYNPFSVMQSLSKARLGEFWYESGTPAFIADYLRLHSVPSLERFRHAEIGESELSAREIDAALPESFLYQAGYLTIEKREGLVLTLDYPNKEVLSAMSRTFLESAFGIGNALPPGVAMVKALQKGDVDSCMNRLNAILSGVASELFRDKHESTYNALFTALLRGARADCVSEANSSRGRCDLKVFLNDKIYVIEFKLAQDESQGLKLLEEAIAQIAEQGYMEPHSDDSRQVIPLAVVFGAKSHSALLWR